MYGSYGFLFISFADILEPVPHQAIPWTIVDLLCLATTKVMFSSRPDSKEEVNIIVI